MSRDGVREIPSLRPRLPDPREQPFMRVPDVAAAFQISESSTYEAIHAGQIPALRVGRRLRVPTAGLWKLAALDPDKDEAALATSAAAAVTATAAERTTTDATDVATNLRLA